jgi:ATP-binding cassette, subfamily B, bacterial PglK
MNLIFFIFKSLDTSYSRILIFFLSTFILAVLEMFSIGVIPAFITVVVSPEKVINFTGHYFNFFDIESTGHVEVVSKVGIILIFFLIIKTTLSLSISHYQMKTLTKYQVALSSKLLERYIYWPYERHLNRNSAELIRNTISIPVNIVSSVLMSLSTIATELLLVAMITGGLIYIQPYITLISLLIFGGFMGLFSILLRKKLKSFGFKSNEFAAKTMLWLNQSLGGIKEIKVAGCERYFLNKYKKHFKEYSSATLASQYLSQVPRHFLELIALVSIIGVTILLLLNSTEQEFLPTIVLFGTVSLRLIPSFNRTWSAFAALKSNMNSVEIYKQDFSNSIESKKSSKEITWKFQKEIDINKVTYNYDNSDTLALDNIKIVIPSNSTTGVAGRSGAGKSTLLDILLGLHNSSAGNVLVDGQNIWDALDKWQACIGYVPQHVYILDDTLRRNIAIGEDDDKINDNRIFDALKKASMAEFVNGLPQKLDTTLGERGGKLSGGQRQRIGIARALYRNPTVLFLDEPTSALDNKSEMEIVETLERLHGLITIVLVSHNAGLLKLCDHIYVLENGKLEASGNIDELDRLGIQFK